MSRDRRIQARTTPTRPSTPARPTSSTLPRSPFGVRIDDVFVTSPGAPRLYAGHDADGQAWLVALTVDEASARRWVCAPASDQAIGCLRLGKAQPADLFRHSSTGSVEVVTAQADGRLVESVRLCTELDDSELPPRLFARNHRPSAA